MNRLKTVLIFDEDRATTAELYEFFKYEFPALNVVSCCFFRNAKEVLKKNQSSAVLILLECHFGGEINARALTRYVRLIGFSGRLIALFDDFSQAKQLLRSGCDEVLPKPFDIKKLDLMVKEMLGENSDQIGI